MGSIKAMLDACDRLAALDIGYDQRERWSFYDRRTDTLITEPVREFSRYSRVPIRVI